MRRMNTLFFQFLSAVMRLLLVALGLAFAAAVAMLAAALGAVLMLRSGWNKLTGKAGPLRAGRMRRGSMPSGAAKAPSMRGRTPLSRMSPADVTDVVAREPS